MISLADRTITLHAKTLALVKFEVWFRTPFGLHTHLDEAVKRVQEADMEPQLSIVPVPVAIDEQGHYEEFSR